MENVTQVVVWGKNHPLFEKVLLSAERCSHLAQAVWGPPCGCLLEEVFLPSSSPSILPLIGPQFAACTDMDRGRMNYIYWSEIHINEGLRFPLPPLVHQFLYFTRIYPVYVHVNIIWVLLGVSVLYRQRILFRDRKWQDYNISQL